VTSSVAEVMANVAEVEMEDVAEVYMESVVEVEMDTVAGHACGLARSRDRCSAARRERHCSWNSSKL